MTGPTPLILLPGQLCDATLWTAQAEALGDIADITVGDLTLDDRVAAMAERVLASARPRFALCGLSLGGYVAFEIIRRAPERVIRLALMNTSARPDRPEQTKRREGLVKAAQAGAFKGVTPRLLPTILHPDHAADAAIAGIVLGMAERIGLKAFERQQAAIVARPDSRPLLAEIACPTLVIGGRADRITPPELQIEIAAGIPSAHLELLETCGHLAPLEQPDTVIRLMREWLG